MGKTSDGSQVLHVQVEKADDLDLSDLYPDAHVVSDSEISSKLHTKVRYLRTDSTTSKIVGQAMLGVVAFVAAVVLGPAMHRGMVSKWGVFLCNAHAWPTTTMLEEV